MCNIFPSHLSCLCDYISDQNCSLSCMHLTSTVYNTFISFYSAILCLLSVAISICPPWDCNDKNHVHDSRRLQFWHCFPPFPKWGNWECSGDSVSTNFVHSVDHLCDPNAHSVHQHAGKHPCSLHDYFLQVHLTFGIQIWHFHYSSIYQCSRIWSAASPILY